MNPGKERENICWATLVLHCKEKKVCLSIKKANAVFYKIHYMDFLNALWH
jgi:hypothetical protein